MSILLWVVLAVVIVGVVVALFGWDRYRGGRKRSEGNTSRPTDELFIDPSTGQRTRVWFDASTGQREYRPE